MNIYVFQAIYILLLTFLAIIIYKKRLSGIGFTPLDTFLIFLLIQYGPHAIFIKDYLRLSPNSNSTQEVTYILIYIFAMLGLCTGYIFSPNSSTIKNLSQKKLFKISCSKSFSSLLLKIAIAYILIFWIIQGTSLPILTENIYYLIGKSTHSYTELRREIFSETLYSSISNSTRHGITALIFSLLISIYLKTKEFRYAVTALMLFLVCASQLNKFPYIYFTILFFLIYYSTNNNGYLMQKLSLRGVFYSLVSIIVLYLILSNLYEIQYKTELEAGLVLDSDIASVLIYRIFFASNDGLRLWSDYYPYISEHIGFSNISSVATLIGTDWKQPNIEVPYYFLGEKLTTIQTGFLGSSYASFGYIGVYFSSIAIVILLKYISIGVASINDPAIRASLLSLFCLNSIFLTTRELHTSLLSGGVLLAPMIFIVFTIFRNSLNRTYTKKIN